MTMMHYLPKELKVCEGCGALWVRTNAADGVYCGGCSTRLREFPAPRGKRAGGRRRKAHVVGSGTAVACKGGLR